MGRMFQVKPIINKKNGQVNFYLSKKKLPNNLRKLIASGSIPILNLKIEGYK